MKDLITIGILNHNGSKYVQQLFSSVSQQDYPHLELIVFDNGSSDDSIQKMQKYKQKFHHFRIIQSTKNIGYCKAKNQIVQESKGKYILLLDEDVILPSTEFISNLINCHREYKSGLTSSVLVNQDDDVTTYIGGFWNFRGYTYRPKVSIKKVIPLSPYPVHSPEGQVLFFNKAFFQKLGGFDEHQPYYLDVGDVGIRSLLLTKKPNIIYTKEPVIHTGIDRKVNTTQWAWKLKFMYPGTMRILIKNFNLTHILVYSIPILAYYLFGSLYQSLKRRSLKVLGAYLWSIGFFFSSFSSSIQLRRQIQSQRLKKNDWFLKSIRRPDFR